MGHLRNSSHFEKHAFTSGLFLDHIHRKSMGNGRLSCFIVFLHDFTLFVIDIHQIMLISLFLTQFDHFHGSAGLVPKGRVLETFPK